MRNRPSLPEWVWAAVNVVFVIIAGLLFFSIDDPVLGTLALAATLIAGELTARLASHWVRQRTEDDR
ncbi:hypothetical protein ACM61V_16210 [Sphingomonas sp. TX0543]|jgi:hypothetical protein|uniref:Uncharacterized protein n=1 Tax=hydrothermal vent metagenome TaxID=652676 RepID=A0A160TNW4_9ZZZZ|nr:hypothetical protein [Sphingomonas sp. 66-10]OJU20370.1 MAG: hypothetical protein BGN95_04580 [Sphingomonas sp. 66-10]